MDEPEAASYLVSDYPEWRKDWIATTVAAAGGPLQRLWPRRLRRRCPGWWWMHGSRYGVHGRLCGDNVHNPKKLEEILVELKFVAAPKLETHCSCSFLPHLEGQIEMTAFLSTDERQGSSIAEATEYWRLRGGYDRRRRKV